MKICLIDLKHPIEGFANRDQTGGFGSKMLSQGLIGKLLANLKKDRIRIPLITFAYMSAIAKQYRHECKISSEAKDEADLIIIATSMIHWKYEIEAAIQVRKINPKSKIGFCGPFCSEYPEKFQKHCDFIMIGEPEYLFRDICTGKINPTQNLYSTDEVDLDQLPFPDWSGFNVDDFGYSPSMRNKPFLTILGSRGCPFACEFCPYIVSQGVKLRRRKNINIIKEITYLIKNYKIKSLLFRDITWSMDLKATKDLCKLLIREQFDIEIAVETRPEMIDYELIQLMKQAGIKVVNLGIESPNTNILEQSGRKAFNNDKVKLLIDELHRNNIKVQAFYIIGLLDDTDESVLKTINYSKFLNTYAAQFCVFTPFPGTKTFQDVKERLLTDDFSKFTEYFPVVKINHLNSKQVLNYLNKAYNEYYTRPNWIIKYGPSVLKSFLN